MDIGTGKPTLTARKILPHYVVDCVEPTAIYSVHQFLIDAARGFSAARRESRELWVVGGTGLYIRALTENLDLGSPPRPELREALAVRLDKLTPRQLAEILDLAPRDPDNPARVIRSAELACRQPARARQIYAWAGLEYREAPTTAGDGGMSAAREELGRWQCAGLAVLDPGREELAQRIVQRTQSMFSGGLVEEVRRLRELGYGSAPVVAEGIGYREAGQVLHGELRPAEAIERTVIRTRQYAKRQRTYIRGRGWPVYAPATIGAWLDSLETG
jgi:tRNA dimethylallyltransferase